MKRKILSMLMILSLIFTGAVFADYNDAQAKALMEHYFIRGEIMEVYEDGSVLVGNVPPENQALVRFTDQTIYVNGTSAQMIQGNYLVVEYNGMATKSIPMQLTAKAVTYNGPEADYMTLKDRYQVSGVILDIYDNGDLLISDDPSDQQVIVHVADTTQYIDNSQDKLMIGNYVIVNYNGVATKSIPMQITALTINASSNVPESPATFFGEIIDISGNSLYVDNPITGEPAIINITDQTTYGVGVSSDFVVGNYVIVEYSGIALMSYPMQIAATKVIYNSDALPTMPSAYEDSASIAISRYFNVDNLSDYEMTVMDQGTYHKVLYKNDAMIAYMAKVDTDTFETYYVQNNYNAISNGLYLPIDQAITLADQNLNNTPAGAYDLVLVDTATVYGYDGQDIYAYLLTYNYMSGEDTMVLYVQINPDSGALITVSGDL